MILQLTDIENIINKKAYRSQFQKMRDQYAIMYMFVTGVGIEDYVMDKPEFMRPGQIDTLINMMHSLSDTIHRVMQPIGAIYTAKGGMEHYNLPEELQSEFITFISNITEGISLSEWIRQCVQNEYFINPNGLVYIDVNEYGEPYPEVRNIFDIECYKPNGRALEYVIFIATDEERAEYEANGWIPANTPAKTPVYRVIDDTTDRIVIMKGKSAQLCDEAPNQWQYVPAQIISDIRGYDKQLRDSPLTCIINLLLDLLNDAGLFKWAYWRESFPKEWSQLFTCPTCDGEKQIDGKSCPECKGSGNLPFLRVADVAKVDWAKDGANNIPTPPIGRIASDVEALSFMKEHNMGLEEWMEYTMWGVKPQLGVGNQGPQGGKGGDIEKTAYETQKNEEPRIKRLRLFAKWKVSVQSFVTDCCGQIIYPEDYEGCAITPGDRYLIESPDASIDRYAKATNLANPLPMYMLDGILRGMNENLYQDNPIELRKAELLRQVEPFVHESVAVIWPDPELPLVSRMMKKYFDEWTNTISDEDIANTPEQGGAEILRGLLQQYVLGRYVSEKNMESLILNAAGQVLAIGDDVKIIWGKEKKPQHSGKQYKIADITDGEATLSGQGMDGVFGYSVGDLYKVPTGQNLIENNQ